jgi:hypothetical protein
MRRARAFLREKSPTEGDRWAADEWLIALGRHIPPRRSRPEPPDDPLHDPTLIIG